MTRLFSVLTIVLWTLSLASPLFAHKPSDSYLKLHADDTLSAQWDIAIRDLDFALGLDVDQDGEITWGEVRTQSDTIVAHALSHLQVSVDGKPCDWQAGKLMVTRHSDGNYVVLSLEADSPGNFAVLDLDYRLFFDIDPTHRGLVLYDRQGVASTHVLSPAEPHLEIRADEVSLWGSFVDYVREGVWHIWIGFDHILFLLSLLIPAVWVFKENAWHPVESFRPACLAVLKIVTVFTIAHSITLWLAVMGYVTLPSQWIEATIAFSILVTALHNLYPVLHLPAWAIALGFGLVHGFGFANVLIDLGLSSTTLAVSLLAFNVGVELGQMTIVVVFLPIAYALRKTSFYRWVIVYGGSVLIAVIALMWMIERIFNVQLLGF